MYDLCDMVTLENVIVDNQVENRTVIKIQKMDRNE